MATHVAPARPLPPVGALLLCLEPGTTAAAYPVTVDRHQGRYFFACGHRFHVYDDWKANTNPTWGTSAAMVWLASPEEQAAAAATSAPRPWHPPAAPAGPPEPTETW